MERISPLYGQDDSTLLIIDSEQTLLDDGHSGSGDETLYVPSSELRADPPRAAWEGGSNGGYADISRPGKERAGNPLLTAAQDVLVFGVEMSTLARDAQ